MNHELTAEPPANASDSSLAHSSQLRSRFHSRLLGFAIAVLAVLLLVVTPPLLKLNRYARRISLSMSQSLGRPVHLDNVSLGLFPLPHLTLQNVVVSEDPAFGNEPIIRANLVEATFRVSSLWRRPMEFSRVRFVEPSVNLVRNTGGQWNLEGVLVHASQVDTAPTGQAHVGSTPRFPYIEAIGGRVNVKIGEEKKPFSLLETDFALWLPSPEQWSLRLTGTPARTDTNLNDPGVLRLEGSLQRAAHMEQVPVTLQMSWRSAPLGEATRLLTGNDQGWRGTVQVDASIKGSLGAGRLGADITLDDLRRADFVPARTLSLHLHCVALTNVPAATLGNLACELPTDGTQPMRLQAEAVDLSRPLAGSATVQAEATPVEWFAAWARLLSPRFPSATLPGTVDASLSRDGAAASQNTDVAAAALPANSTGEGPLSSNQEPSATPPVVAREAGPGQASDSALGNALGNALGEWIGNITLHLPLPPAGTETAGAADGSVVLSPGGPAGKNGQSLTAEVLPGTGAGTWRIALAPAPVRITGNSTLIFSGTGSADGYQLRAAGTASPAALLELAKRLPPLGDHLATALGPVAAEAPVRLDLTCSRAWTSGSDQTCVRNAEPVRKPAGKLRRPGR